VNNNVRRTAGSVFYFVWQPEYTFEHGCLVFNSSCSYTHTDTNNRRELFQDG